MLSEVRLDWTGARSNILMDDPLRHISPLCGIKGDLIHAQNVTLMNRATDHVYVIFVARAGRNAL